MGMTAEQIRERLGYGLSDYIDPDMPENRYHASPGVSNSMLARFAKSPLHLLHYLENGSEQTQAMAFGSATHVALLEPEKLRQQYLFTAEDKRTTKGWKESAKQAEEEGKHPLTRPDAERMMAIREAVWNHPYASILLERAWHREFTMAAPFSHSTPVLVRGRADLVTTRDDESPIIIADLKTTASVDARDIQRSINRYRYDMQAAVYSFLAEQAFDPESPGLFKYKRFTARQPQEVHSVSKHVIFQFIFVEKDPPHDVSVVELDRETMQRAAYDLEDAITRLDKWVQDGCQANGRNPSKITMNRWEPIA